MGNRTDIMLLYRIARHYYIDHLSQQEISDIENISRSQISRLLNKAHEMGIIRVQVEIPKDLDCRELAQALRAALHLNDVIVAPMGGDKDAQPADAIAAFAADALPRLLKGSKIVGLGWGRTMYQISLRLSYKEVDSERFYVPMIGLSGAENPFLQINSIVDRFAEKHRSRCYFVTLPAVRESNALSSLEEERLLALHAYWQRLDAAVIGLGPGPTGMDRLVVSEYSDEYAHMIANSGTSGEILSQCFYQDGSIFDSSLSYQQLMYSLFDLPRVKNVICVAGGKDKIEGILTAARARYFNTLITDSHTAPGLLVLLRERGEL